MANQTLPMSKGHTCAHCHWCGIDCIVEREDRFRPNACPSFYDDDEYSANQRRQFERTGEWWDEW